MKTVILLSGKKSTGKDTSYDYIKDFFKCADCGGTGRRDGLVYDFQLAFPHCEMCLGKGYGYTKKIKKMSFADPLKSLCKSAFGLTDIQCYGESGERETSTVIRWEDLNLNYHGLRGEKHIQDFVTAREILQIVGTNVMRSFYPNVWAKAATIAAMKSEEDIVVFTDARFPNEIEEFQVLADDEKINLLVLRLHRDSANIDSHKSETALDSWDEEQKFQYNIFNNGSLDELKEMLRSVICEGQLIND